MFIRECSTRAHTTRYRTSAALSIDLQRGLSDHQWLIDHWRLAAVAAVFFLGVITATRRLGRGRAGAGAAQLRVLRGAAHPDLRCALGRDAGARARVAAGHCGLHGARVLGRGCVPGAPLSPAEEGRGRDVVVRDVDEHRDDLPVRVVGLEPARVLPTGDVRHGPRRDGVDAHYRRRLQVRRTHRRYSGAAPASAGGTAALGTVPGAGAQCGRRIAVARSHPLLPGDRTSAGAAGAARHGIAGQRRGHAPTAR